MSNSEHVNGLDNFVAHMEGRVKELGGLQKTMLKLFNELVDEFRTMIDGIRGEMAETNTQVSLTMRDIENHTPSQAYVGLYKLKNPNSKAWNLDAKELENFIFDVEQYFKATGTCPKDLKVMLATMQFVNNAKFW